MSFRAATVLFHATAILVPLGIAVLTDGFDRLLLAAAFALTLIWIWRELHRLTIIATSRIALDELRQRQVAQLLRVSAAHSRSDDRACADRPEVPQE